MMRCAAILVCLILASFGPFSAADGAVRIKDLGHFQGWHENALVGYGIVTGLSGSGDSARNLVTKQALANVLSRLGAHIPATDVQSRNVAAVVVTAKLPPAARVGDNIDLTVTSIGDARSLVGGTLLMTPLLGPDQRRYALGQGTLVVGGYDFQDNGNVRRMNYPTSGIISGGGMIEVAVDANLVGQDGRLTFVLRDPDFSTAQLIADGLNETLGPGTAVVDGSNAVLITVPATGRDIYRYIARLENVAVTPEQAARVVINERSGTVVAGGGVRVSSVVIVQGDIKVSVDAENNLLDPAHVDRSGRDGRSYVYTNSRLNVIEDAQNVVVRSPDATVADLVQALARARISTRNTIVILQAMKAAGALHADIVVQ
jgi:flagellar P-ring protein FlgI